MLAKELLLAGAVMAFAPASVVAAAKQAEEKEKAKAEEEENKQLLGIKLGGAFGVAASSAEEVQEAQVVGGLVRVTRSQKAAAGVWLEAHRLFKVGAFSKPLKARMQSGAEEQIDRIRAAIGPFVSVQSSSEKVIDAIGAGVMIGFRQPASDHGSFNVGLGIALAPRFRTLGDGITANQPLPEGETEIRYRERSRFRVMVLFSFAP